MEPIKGDPKNPLHSLRTYQGDVDEALSKNKTSVSSIVIAEQKRRDETLALPEEKQQTESRNRYFIIIGGILVLIGIGVLLFVYYIQPSNTVTLQQKAKTLIGFSSQKSIPLININRDQLSGTIAKEIQGFKLPPNAVLYLNTVNASSTAANVGDTLGLLAPRMPSSLPRSFENDYMLGVYSFDVNAPFIILTTTDYATSYSGMLKWEPDMLSDLGSAFGITSTTTSAFIDASVQNKDLRELKNEQGQVVLLYSFIDKNTLVITTRESILTGIVGKYLVTKTTR